jgi:hypothetical protein
MGSGSVYKVEENLEEAYAICDDILAQGVSYDLQLSDEEFNLFEGRGTGESIASIKFFLQNQETVIAFYSRTIDECHGASQGNNSKG